MAENAISDSLAHNTALIGAAGVHFVVEVFLESSQKVAEEVDCGLEKEKGEGLKEWAPCFYPKGQYDRLKSQWKAFGL